MVPMMEFLVSNDDGYLASGIIALASTLSYFGKVIVVAPEREQSGASNSLTLNRPLTVHQADNLFYYVNGTPTDCVRLAMAGLLRHKPDMVFSGINHGTNMGEDTLYSGTVAAAVEGFLFGIPAVAISMAGKSGKHLATAQTVIKKLVTYLLDHPPKIVQLLNINVPDIPLTELKGLKATRLGRRHQIKSVTPMQSPRGHPVYWVGETGEAQDAGHDTDFWACEQGFASITPLTVDLTARNQVLPLEHWLSEH